MAINVSKNKVLQLGKEQKDVHIICNSDEIEEGLKIYLHTKTRTIDQ